MQDFYLSCSSLCEFVPGLPPWVEKVLYQSQLSEGDGTRYFLKVPRKL